MLLLVQRISGIILPPQPGFRCYGYIAGQEALALLSLHLGLLLKHPVLRHILNKFSLADNYTIVLHYLP